MAWSIGQSILLVINSIQVIIRYYYVIITMSYDMATNSAIMPEDLFLFFPDYSNHPVGSSKRYAQTRDTASITSTEKFWAFSYKQRKPWRRMTIAQRPNRSDKQGLTALRHCYSYNTGGQPNPISLIQKQKVKQLSARSREIRRILKSFCRHCIFRLYFPFRLLRSQSSLNSSLDGIPSPLF